MLLHHFDGTDAVVGEDTQQVQALRQTFQVDYCGVSLDYALVNLRSREGCEADVMQVFGYDGQLVNDRVGIDLVVCCFKGVFADAQ